LIIDFVCFVMKVKFDLMIFANFATILVHKVHITENKCEVRSFSNYIVQYKVFRSSLEFQLRFDQNMTHENQVHVLHTFVLSPSNELLYSAPI